MGSKVEYDFDVFSPEPIDYFDSISSPCIPNGANVLNVEEERGVPSVVHESDEERFYKQDDDDDLLPNDLDNEDSEEENEPHVRNCE